MSARDEAIEAAAKAMAASWHTPWGAMFDDERAETLTAAETAVAAAVPVLLNDLADHIELVGAGDENVAWSKGMLSAVLLVRHAAEGWGQ